MSLINHVWINRKRGCVNFWTAQRPRIKERLLREAQALVPYFAVEDCEKVLIQQQLNQNFMLRCHAITENN